MKTETITIRLNYSDESTRRELTAYRRIGSVAYLNRLKQEEIRRRRQWKHAKRVLENVLFWSILAFDIWVAISIFSILYHDAGCNFFNIFF